MYAMDMRQYDPAIARWVVQDPVVHHNMSPYNAFDNNPVYWADPSGADATSYINFLWNITPQGTSAQYGNTSNESNDDPPTKVDEYIKNRGIDSFGPQKPTFKKGTSQWQKDFENWNYKIELDHWAKKTTQEKWVIARNKVLIEGINNEIRESVEQIAQLYTALTYMGGSGMSSGLRTLSSNAGKVATSQFSKSTIDDAVGLVMKDPNKVAHLFAPKHNLGGLVSKFGGEENTIRAVLNAADGKLPSSGVFNDIPVNIGGQNVLIRGNVINGTPRLGTMFIP